MWKGMKFSFVDGREWDQHNGSGDPRCTASHCQIRRASSHCGVRPHPLWVWPNLGHQLMPQYCQSATWFALRDRQLLFLFPFPSLTLAHHLSQDPPIGLAKWVHGSTHLRPMGTSDLFSPDLDTTSLYKQVGALNMTQPVKIHKSLDTTCEPV